jgi:type IV secretion system protein VirB4
VQTLHLAGFPFETAPDEELNYRKAIRETVLRGAASSRLAIYHHVVRRRVTRPSRRARGAFCARLDARWREQLAGRRLYVNDIFPDPGPAPTQGSPGSSNGDQGPARPATPTSARTCANLHATRDGLRRGSAYGARNPPVPHNRRRRRPALGARRSSYPAARTADLRPVFAPTGDLSNAIGRTSGSASASDAMEFAARWDGPGSSGPSSR